MQHQVTMKNYRDLCESSRKTHEKYADEKDFLGTEPFVMLNGKLVKGLSVFRDFKIK